MYHKIKGIQILWWHACIALCLAGNAVVVHAAGGNGQIWTFVDNTGVVHIGNSVPPATSNRVTWVERKPEMLVLRDNWTPTVLIKQLPGYEAAKIHLNEAAQLHSLDPALVVAVAAAESSFKPDAVSQRGAVGLMQVMPSTAEQYGVGVLTRENAGKVLLDPQINAEIGSRHLASLMRTFDGDLELALAAYNSGEGAVMKHGRRIPPFLETQKYVFKVMRYYQTLIGRPI